MSDVLVFVGGGSAATAGGIKVSTFVLLAVVIWSEIRSEEKVHVLGGSMASGAAAGPHSGVARRWAGVLGHPRAVDHHQVLTHTLWR